MKLLLLFSLVLVPTILFSQGATCAGMDPICTDVGANFTANTGTTAEPGNNYGCLITQPNPSWYYFEIATNGNIDMSLTAGSDIDFIIWGPYANLAAAQANCGSLGAGNQVDCSYSATNNETPSIPNAQVGEVYIMLITNYASVVQDVTLTQTGGTGSTDCNIVNNPPCFMNYFEASVGACDAGTGTYEVTGTIEFDNPPATGDLIVVDCDGNQVIVASAPFAVNGQGEGLENFTLAGLDPDGLGCSVTAYFSADPTCSLSLNYTAPECLCFISFMSVNQEPCDVPSGTFSLSGYIEFESPPTTGVLTISDCNGNTNTFFPPFVSPQNFALTGITPNGTTNCTITAQFSADPSCVFDLLTYDHPANCDCPVDAGSFTATITGNTTNSYELCFGDSFTLTPNGDFIPPDDIGDDGTFSYNPGMWYFIYDCPPSIQAPNDFTSDPCLLGAWDTSTPFGPWTVDNVFGDNNTYYFVPVTFYDYVNGIYSYFFAGTLCYDTGNPYPITFLEPIVENTVEDCFAGTATTTVSGGAPAFDGSNFTVVPGSLSPASASFDNTSAPNGGTITISGLLDGDAYSYDIQDENGCPITVSGIFQGMQDATFSYNFKYCQDEPNPLPVITGVAGGTFSATPAGLVINPFTGLINLAASTPGTYTVQYVSPAATCWGTETFVLTVNPLPLVVPTEDSPICDDGVSTIQLGENGGEATEWLWSSSGGATITATTDQNPVVSNATNGEVFTVQVTNVNTGCTNSAQIAVTVTPMEDPTFSLADFCEGAANSATVTGTAGGAFAFNPVPGDGATINASTGEISNEVGGTTYSIEYTTPGVCFDSSIETVTVNPTPTVDPIGDIAECAGTAISVAFNGAVAGTQYNWTNTNTGIGLGANGTGDIASFNGVNAGAAPIIGTVTVTPSANGCLGTPEDFTITINPLEDATFTLTDYCEGAANSATIVGSAGGTFAFNPAPGDGATINGATGEITNGVGGTTYTVEYTTAGVCFDVSTETVTVNPTPTVDPIADIAECAGTAISVAFNGVVAGTQYNWTNTNTGIGLGANGTGDIASFNGVNAGAAPIVGTVTVTPSANGCLGTPEDFTITINPLEDATFTLTDYCEGAANSATIVGSAGGTFAFNPAPGDGATINGATGEITNGVGGTTYTVEYTTAGVCFDVSTETVTVNPTPTVDPIGDIAECAGTAISVAFNGAVAGTQYDWTNTNTGIGLGANGTGDIASFNGVNAGAAPIIGTVTVTPTANGCLGSAEDFTITINPLEDATFTLTDYCEGAANSATIVGSAGGTFDFNPVPGDGATINGATGEITNGVGGTTYTVEYTTTGVCFDASTETVTVNPLDDATFTLTDFCEGAGNAATITGTAGGTFAFNPAPGDGATINGATGEITNGIGGTTYSVEYTTAGICPQSSIENVAVNPLGDPTFTLVDFCEGEVNAANITGDIGGTFIFNPAPGDGATVNGATGEISNEVGGTTYSVEYTTAGLCPQSSTENVAVNPNPTPVIVGDLEYCQGTSATVSADAVYSTYNWSTGDNTQNITVTVADNPITLEVTNGFGCTGTSPNYNVAENNVLVYNSSLEICQGESIDIHGNMESVAGVYSATFPLPNGCDSTANVTLVVNPLPVVNAGADVTLCNGEFMVLQGTGADSYAWDNGLGVGNNFNVSPVTTTTYEVTGTDANGCVNTDQVTVTVNPLPTASIAGTTSICENDASPNVTITGANGTAPYTFTYNINGGADIVVGSAGNDAVISVPNSPAGTYTYNIVSVEDASATNCSQAQVGSATVTINPNPTPAIVGDIDYCEGFTATISADAVYTTYDWSTGANTQSIDVTAADNPITLTVTNGFGCSGISGAYNVIENPTPIVNAGNDVTICVGSQTTLSATGAVSYVWDNGLGAGNNFDVSPAINTTYTVVGTDANGCVGTDDMEVIVNDPPTATIDGTATLCENAPSPSVTFTGANGTAPYIFTYTINGGPDLTVNSGAGNDAVIVVPNNPAGTYVYDLVHVEESSANNCGQDQVGSVTITINGLPNVNAGTDIVACDGDEVTLNASGAVDYVWDNGVTDGVPFTPANGVYTVTGTDVNGCENSDDVLITVSPVPVPSFDVDVPICEPFIVTLTNTTPGVSANCVWQLTGQAPINGCGPITLTLSDYGTYDVTLTTSNAAGCTASVTELDAFTLEESPNAAFSPPFADLSSLNTEVNFINNSTGATSYEWHFGDGTANSNATNPSHTYPDESGTYSVMLVATSNSGCVDTAYGNIRVRLEVIYYVPNTFTPDNDSHNQFFKPVFTSGYDPYDYTLLIFNRWGEIVFESHDVDRGWDGTYAGNYIVQDGTYTWKIEFKTIETDERVMDIGHVNVLR